MKSLIAFLSLVVIVVIARWPFLLNARDLNSDHAIVGLQAMHILKGEWSWFLWGCDYQASFEPVVAAGLFSIFGTTAQAILGVSLLTSFLLLYFVWTSLEPWLGVKKSWLLLIPFCIGSYFFIRNNLYPPRHWCVVAIFLGVWLMPKARDTHSVLLLELAGILPFIALYIDFFAIQMLIPYLIYAAVCLKTREKWTGFFIGVFVGGVFLAMSRNMGPKSGAPLAFNPGRLIDNFPLLWETCLPRMLGLGSGITAALGAAIFLILLFFGLRFLWKREFENDLDCWGLFAWLTVGQTLLGFLGSSMAADENAVRYLTPILYVFPWAVAPLVHRSGWLVPAIAALGVLGTFQHIQVTHEFYPAGWWTKSAKAEARDEEALASWLREKKVDFAYADYWDAYRLGFLWQQDPPVSPHEPHRVRYRGYPTKGRGAFIRSPGTEMELPPGEKKAFGGYTAVVVEPVND